MRVLDLLEMLRDIDKNESVWAHLDKINYSISSTEIVNDSLVLTLSQSHRSLKNWELSLMLNKKERLYLPIMLTMDKKNHQVFGMRLDDNKIVLY